MNTISAMAQPRLKDYVALTKPRITLLVVITAYTGMWLAAAGPPSLMLTLLTLCGIGLASAASCALNNYFDHHIDALMTRTQQRGLPSGAVEPKDALWLGLGLNILAFLILLFGVNALSAWLAVATVFFYVVVYTLLLKRMSPLCTFIGGVAGALPPVIGWAAVTGDIGMPAWILFAILMLWQPPHFWALAILRVDDYRRARIPMLPVARGERVTKRQMLLYTIVLLPVSLLLYIQGWTGFFYLTISLTAGLGYLGLTIYAVARPTTPQLMKRLFGVSILYLFLIFLAAFLDCSCQVSPGWM